MTVDEYFAALPYEADAFQREAAELIARGETVVVTAPTGAGKTLIAEFAVALAHAAGERAFYTTPIKALSNQKYQDFVDIYGEHDVGLLTGDNSINGDAPIVVMTTEVLRNMIYAQSSALNNLRIAVLDEVHYLADRIRGSVWEEVIIHAPEKVQLVCLSATIANPEEFTHWVQMRRGPTSLVLESHRPVPLQPKFMVTDLWQGETLMFDMFEQHGTQTRPNRRVLRLLASKTGRRKRFATPRRPEVVETLASEGMLPAIYFIFSRAGCEAATRRVAATPGLRLTSREERSEIRRIALERTDHLPADDLSILQFGEWLSDLEAGVAPHHAGMVPAFKETVEELFERGLLKVVFATETLALGINMPARSVVLDSMSKFDGESHVLLGPSDYTQLTGRAGRRGIDVVGYGVSLHSKWTKFERLAAVAAAGSSRLESSFKPTYNMAVNLIANYERELAEDLLRASFAEFQRDAEVNRAVRRRNDRLSELAAVKAQAECERGDIWAYAEIVDRVGRELVEDVAPGDVMELSGGRAPARYLVIQVHPSAPSPVAMLSTAGKVRRFTIDEMAAAQHLGRIAMPKNLNPRDRRGQQRLVQRLRTFHGQPDAGGVDHPVAGCPDVYDHMRMVRKARRLERSVRVADSGVGLVDEFRAVLAVLEERGYTEGWRLRPPGERLRYLYSEQDLLIAETMLAGHLDALAAPDLAAAVSGFVYESRLESDETPPPMGLAPTAASITAMWEELVSDETQRGLSPTRRPDFGFAELAYHWAQGFNLEEILEETMMAPGDFVRVSRQLLDVLRQIRDAAPQLADTADEAMRRVDRGVVAAGGIG